MAGSSPAMTTEETSATWLAAYASTAYRFFHPPRLPGAPPVERGEGPNSGPESRELFGWMILLVSPNGFAGSARLGR